MLPYLNYLKEALPVLRVNQSNGEHPVDLMNPQSDLRPWISGTNSGK